MLHIDRDAGVAPTNGFSNLRIGQRPVGGKLARKSLHAPFSQA
jgi:hypothetical protein